MTEQLKEGLAQLGLTPPEGAVAQMARYAGLLLEQNKVMNLTAIKEPAQVAALHFLDSAALLGCADLRGKSLVDVGTGAGFPGMVLKLMVPELRLTLVDSLGKRLDWLGEVCGALGLEGVERRHARAEELALQSGWRDSFDFATARAVAELRVLCEICLPYVKVGGRFLAMKAADCDEELSAAAHGAELLGGRLLPSYRYHIPGTEVDRRVIVVEKVAPTPKGYPRRWARSRNRLSPDDGPPAGTPPARPRRNFTFRIK
ncbi:16S rRNA (guanine(527)-N(7))-methyltransferase RsmG [Intestinimonas butyriciproducens]|uniref:16S rRNA (guanine(527)-N(7))-methyltransferase RsmG n=2 Tax=Intestinimonas butyriciproducens TaxID=1297617 RepID=UPI00242E9AAA|nr:16S rRNA (guanine(527)-N(7))-methyltransferase RsmG [Intestinimonas butyriciproducens]MCI6363383.1 16S rRNA (guanine(527)-N(7))-methyltransferase RsmG [Intestinimonas butyriciproducens]MDY3616706.1 16S rRNA (guanine(527)-N(7))-methyltransferase RsmG [Intestinimonas butyriciproducens]